MLLVYFKKMASLCVLYVLLCIKPLALTLTAHLHTPTIVSPVGQKKPNEQM